MTHDQSDFFEREWPVVPETPASPPDPHSTDPAAMLRRLMNAVELAFRANDQEIYGADGAPHAFEVSFDGDGFNEPFTVDASCTCGGWVRDWVQADPAQTGRPEAADLLLEWDEHYESLTEADTAS